MKSDKDFPSLKLGYGQVKDVLQEQVEIARDYSNRAITLFSIAIAVLGIGLLLLLTRVISVSIICNHIPLIVFSVIPIILFVFVFVYFWKIYKMNIFVEIANPDIVINEFIELEPNKFYSEMIQHINSAFDKNEIVIRKKEKDLKILIVLTLSEISTLIILTLLFFSFGLF